MAALVLLEPHAIEAGPLPGYSRSSGGRCYPHSKKPFYLNGGPGFKRNHRAGAASLNIGTALGTDYGLVDEAAQPHIHHQANRQEHEQCGRSSVAHQRQWNPRHGHCPDNHGHIH